MINILLWALFGLIAGIAAKYLFGASERTDPTGIFLTIVLGIAGAIVGGFLSTKLFGWDFDTFSLGGFAVAVVGALILLFLYAAFHSARKSR
jgi:uncharacterized membrane protein YeaQ/YmgE (transglycosylase-associated protein family)